VSARVLVSTTTFGLEDPAPLDRLRRLGFDVSLNPHGRRLKPEEAADLLKDVDGVIAGTEKLTAEVLRAAPRLKVISRCGGGLDNVDLAAAEAGGVRVYNTPEAPRQAVAELAMALILAALRRVPAADARLRAGVWKPEMGRLLFGKTLGIVGLGGVGRRVAEMAAPFRARVLAAEKFPDKAFVRRHKIRLVSFRALMKSADVVTLHVTLDAGTRRLVGREALALMKPGAVLVNTARGELVDSAALAEALKAGRLGGAGLDVFDTEPYEGPLRELPNVVLTPHMGSYATEARVAMEAAAVKNLLAGFKAAGVKP
jgi:D-3-phosphoglycerate dehydrogenase / 2-oxoglutarate reductase